MSKTCDDCGSPIVGTVKYQHFRDGVRYPVCYPCYCFWLDGVTSEAVVDQMISESMEDGHVVQDEIGRQAEMAEGSA